MARSLSVESKAPSAIDSAIASFLHAQAHGRRLSPHTILAYGRDLAQLQAFLKKRGVTEFEAIDLKLLRAFLAELAEVVQSASIGRKIAALRGLYRHLEKTGVISKNPASLLRSPKVRRKLPVVLNVDAAAALMAGPAREAHHLRDVGILELFYSSGLRISELVSLNVDAMVPLGGSTHVHVVGKGRKERWVPVGPTAERALRRYIEEERPLIKTRRDPDALFLSSHGRRLSVRAIQLMVKAAGIVQTGRADLVPHAMRHTCATHMLEGGADLRVIQEFLGHESLTTTQRYTHVAMDHLVKVYDQAHPLTEVRFEDFMKDAG